MSHPVENHSPLLEDLQTSENSDQVDNAHPVDDLHQSPAITVSMADDERAAWPFPAPEVAIQQIFAAAWMWLLARDKIDEPDRQYDVQIAMMPEAEMQHLNLTYRGKDKPTNILSFPCEQEGLYEWLGGLGVSGEDRLPLGDLALCPSIIRAEAESQGKSLEAHTTHLLLHGFLHLLGFDHEEDAEAEEMEAIEIAILAELGYADPYAS